MAWKFYSANDDDYKITAQDEESDDLQTPISEEQESGDKSVSRKSELDEPKSTVIKPVQDVISPVLENSDDLRDSGYYPFRKTNNEDDWQREPQIHPEIQNSSIWKPRTSPLSHPNAQPDENTTISNDGKSPEIPLDLTVRDQVKPQEFPVCCTKTGSTAAIKTEQRLSLGSSTEEDMSDEESFSTLAAFCQAKVSALYPGMQSDDETTPSDDTNQVERPTFIEVKDKVSVRERMIHIIHKDKITSSADTAKSVVHLIRLDPSPQKKIKLTKPSKIKIDLSMPLCSPEAPSTISRSKEEKMNRDLPHQTPNHMVGIEEYESLTTETESPADFEQTYKIHVSKEMPNSKIECEEIPTMDTEKTSLNKNPSDEPSSEEASQYGRPGSQIEVEKSTLSLMGSTSREINGSPLLHGASPITNPHKIFPVQGLKVLPTANMCSVLYPKTDPIPVTFVQNISTPVGFSSEVENCTQNQYYSTTNNTLQAFSPSSNQQSVVTSVTGTESGQKLPSIDQIFRPLNKTSLVTTPTVAANVEISGTSENTRFQCRRITKRCELLIEPIWQSMRPDMSRHLHLQNQDLHARVTPRK